MQRICNEYRTSMQQTWNEHGTNMQRAYNEHGTSIRRVTLVCVYSCCSWKQWSWEKYFPQVTDWRNRNGESEAPFPLGENSACTKLERFLLFRGELFLLTNHVAGFSFRANKFAKWKTRLRFTRCG